MISPKGSIWRKWDLHVHTPDSILQNDFYGKSDEEKWKSYLDKLEELDDVSVLGVTDYLSLDGYKKLADYKAKGKLANIDLLLPNIELRIVPETEKSKGINLHLIFSPEVVDDLESKLFSQLSFEYTGETFTCTKEDLIKLGKKYLKNDDNSNFGYYKEGVNQFKTDVGQLRTIFNRNPKLREKCLIVVSNNRKDGASGIQHSSLAATREDLYYFVDAIFSANPSDIKYFLGKGTDQRDIIIKKFGKLKSCIHGSDAHSLEKICNPDKNRYCWIKSDPTFEGLRQIIYEPELRVRIQEENPEFSETYPKISKISVSLPNDLKILDDSKLPSTFCLSGQHYFEFSNNLTCIIGGRGSGKSTLMHLLYNKWSNKEQNKLTDIESPLINVNLSPQILRNLENSTESEIPNSAEFFFQNELENSAKDIKSMSKLIRFRLEKLSSTDNSTPLVEIQNSWADVAEMYGEVIVSFDNIIRIENNIRVIEKDIDTLTNQTEVIQSDKYKELQDAISQTSKKISDFRIYSDEYAKIINDLEALLKRLPKLKWTNEQGKDVLTNIHKFISESIEQLKEKNKEFTKSYNANNYQAMIAEQRDEFKKYLSQKGISAENIEDLATASQKINDLRNEIRVLKEERVPYESKYSENESILFELQQKYNDYKSRFQEVARILEYRLEGLSISENEISFSIIFDRKLLISEMVQFVKENCKDESLKTNVIENILFSDIELESMIDNKDKVLQVFDSNKGADKHRKVLSQLFNDEDFLTQFHLRLQKEFYNINSILIQTKLGTKALERTSFGERCAIVIAILIVAGTNPIIIDQPEDHLDGKFISDVLVPLIRNQKANRQIILITRDANIVIGSDAELIQILEVIDERTHTYASTIENLENRSKYIWILDGGAVAFSKREKKYNIDLMLAEFS